MIAYVQDRITLCNPIHKHSLLGDGNKETRPQRICYSHWANGARNGVISIGQLGVLIMKKAPSASPFWQLKKSELLLPLSFLITKPIKLDLSNLHYRPRYEPH